MSLNDFLAELAVKYEGLETLYLDIGTPDLQKDEESQTLFEKLLVVLNDHIQQVAQTKDTFTQETDRMWEDMQRMTRLMGQGDEASAKMIDTLANMSLWDRRVTLQEEYNYVYEQYNQKLEEIRTLYTELAAYIPILGPAFVHPGPYPEEGAEVSFEVVQTFSDNIAVCEKEQKTRIKQVESDIAIIKELWAELGPMTLDSFDREVIEGGNGEYPISDDILRRLEMKKNTADVARLWEKLRIDEEERQEFQAEHTGFGAETIRAYKDEKSRLEDLRIQKVQDFIIMEREEIHELWQTLRYSLEQQESFTPYFNDNFTEENLTTHEREATRLKLEAEEAAHVLDIVARYEDRLRAIKELELATRDVDRYKAKGAPGRLLKEEKDRKLNARELPKLEAELVEALNRWEEEKGRPFLVYGEEYIDTMKTAASLAREGKENEKQLREPEKDWPSVPQSSPYLSQLDTSGRKLRTEVTNAGIQLSYASNTNIKEDWISKSTRYTYIPAHQDHPIFHSYNANQGTITHSPLRASSVDITHSKQSAVRALGPASTTTASMTLDGNGTNDKRNHSIISISSTTTEVQVGPSTPTRGPRTGQPISYDLTGFNIDGDEEMPPRTPRSLKRTAAELSSPISTPPGSPSLYHHRKNTRSVSTTGSENMSERTRSGYMESPFMDEEDSLLDMAAVQAQRSPSVVGRSSPFVQQLLETTRYGETTATAAAAATAANDFAREASVIEMNRAEAEAFFSTPRKQVVVVDLVQGQDDGSEGWVTDTDESPQSRRQSRAGRQNPDTQTANLAT
ncbi:hypothetical protein BGZ95_009644 [Linnemannia exigua]|uniref:Microtubule associated protein n=1 Tax=Linnemannia exigua TaxID=604196 RepID=A0AAD4DEM7_9FUNG|nr:hypothetical protein BGZ95_009644 [Linnemannia exigua]